MSQLELALLADVAILQMQSIETDLAEPSHDTISRLAEAMDLGQHEHDDLLFAAGHTPLAMSGKRSAEDRNRLTQAMRQLLGNHEPFPAITCDRAWNIRRANAPARMLLDRMAQPGGNQNLLTLLVAPGPARSMIQNWPEVARTMRSRLRQRIDACCDIDPDLIALYEEIKSHTRGLGADNAPSQDPVWRISLAFDGRILNFFTLALAVEDCAARPYDLGIEYMFPQDTQTEDYLHLAAPKTH